MYLAESQHQGANINKLNDAFWWATATVTTVGYGDFYPVTLAGSAHVLRNSYLWTSTCHCTYAKSRSTSKNKVQSGLLLLLLGGGHDDTKTVIKYKIDEIENLTQQDFDTLLIMIKGLRHTWILRTNISAQGVVVLIMAKQTFAATVVLILDSL